MEYEVFYLQIVALGLLVLAAHYGGRLTQRLRVGEVVGQVLGGLVAGPILLFFIEHEFPAYREALHSLHFFTFVFLSLIAFGIGDELRLDRFKSMGKTLITMSLIEGLVTFTLVTVVFLLLGFEPVTALIIGSIGIATAPAATFAIMNKLDIGGRMRSLLGGLVVVDDVIEVLFFSIMCQIALQLQGGTEVHPPEVLGHVARELGFALLLGLVVFAALRLAVERRWLLPKTRARTPRRVSGPEFISRLISEMPGPSVHTFIIVAGIVSLGVGLALHWKLPFLITAVSAGVFISNFYSRAVFKSLRIEGATSMYTLVFFALIGASADLRVFHPENIPFILAYVGARTCGKMGGTWLGCKVTGQEKRLARLLPRLMLPQAGVAAVEAFYVATVLGDQGQTVLGIILPGLIVFEVVGVLTSERALIKWRSWTTGGGDLIGSEEAIRAQLEDSQLTVPDFLHPESLRVPFEARSKGEAIWQLICTVQSGGNIEDPGKVLDIVLQRERQGGITLGEGVAILHGRIPGLERPEVALGILPKGQEIVCGGSEDEKASIIYLVLSPPEPPSVHLQVLAAIARLLSDTDTRVRLRYAADDAEAMEIIREHAARRAAST